MAAQGDLVTRTEAEISALLDRLWSEHETLLAGPRKTELEHAIAAAHLELGRRHWDIG